MGGRSKGKCEVTHEERYAKLHKLGTQMTEQRVINTVKWTKHKILYILDTIVYLQRWGVKKTHCQCRFSVNAPDFDEQNVANSANQTESESKDLVCGGGGSFTTLCSDMASLTCFSWSHCSRTVHVNMKEKKYAWSRAVSQHWHTYLDDSRSSCACV